MKLYLVFIFFFFLFGTIQESEAQIKTNLKLSHKTQRRVDAVKAARNDLKRLSRKERKEILRQRKLEEQEWAKKSDSLRSIILYKREYKRQWGMVKDKYTPDQLVELQKEGMLDFDTIPDMETWDRFLLEQLMENKDLLQINEMDKLDAKLAEWDALQKEIEKATVNNPINTLKDPNLSELGEEGQMSQEILNKLDEVQAVAKSDFKSEEAKKKIAKIGAEKLAANSKKVEQAQKKLSKLKRKYSWLPNSNDLSKGIKENSLLGAPLKERLVWGGYLQIEEGKPVRIDFSPQVSYFFNKKISMGVGMTYRFTLGKEDSVKAPREVPAHAFGGRSFFEMKAIKGFSAHAEYEALKTSKREIFGDKAVAKWNHGLMLGISKTVNLTRGVKTGVLLMYNFLYKDSGPYPRPWVIRFGFQF